MPILAIFLLVAGIVIAVLCRSNMVLLVVGVIIAVIGALILFGSGISLGGDDPAALLLTR